MQTKAIIGTIVVIAIAGVAAWRYWPAPNEAHAELTLADPSVPLSETISTRTVRDADYLARPLTMRDLFETDFTAEANGFGPTLKAQAFGAQFTLHNDQSGENYAVPVKIIYGIENNSRYLAYFIPKTLDPLNIARALSADPEELLRSFDKYAVASDPGSANRVPKGAPFAHAVVFYFEQDPAPQQLEQIKALFKAKNIAVDSHGQDYLFAHWQEQRLRPQLHKLGGSP